VNGLELSDADVEVSEVAWVPLESCPRGCLRRRATAAERVPVLLAETA
jgi:hypothetical protein